MSKIWSDTYLYSVVLCTEELRLICWWTRSSLSHLTMHGILNIKNMSRNSTASISIFKEYFIKHTLSISQNARILLVITFAILCLTCWNLLSHRPSLYVLISIVLQEIFERGRMRILFSFQTQWRVWTFKYCDVLHHRWNLIFFPLNCIQSVYHILFVLMNYSWDKLEYFIVSDKVLSELLANQMLRYIQHLHRC